jgi:hypothetical protein
MWAVEIYDQDYLTANPITLARLQMNKIVNNKANADGDNFVLLHRTLQAIPDNQRKDIYLSMTKFFAFMRQVFVTVRDAESRWLPLFKHKEWNEQLVRLVRHPWGRRNLVVGNVARAISGHHPRIFLHCLAQVDRYFHQVFLGHHLVIAYIIKKGPDFALYNLRALFFPSWSEDFVFQTHHTEVMGELHRLDRLDLLQHHRSGTHPDWPVLMTPVEVDGCVYRHRRTDFLALLSDADYIVLFQHLQALPIVDLTFPPWDQIMRDDAQGVSKSVRDMLEQVVSWIDPTYKFLRTTAPNALSWKWDDVVKDVILRNVKDPRPAPRNIGIRNSPKQVSEQFMDMVWSYVREHYYELNNVETKHWVGYPFPANKIGNSHLIVSN